MGDFDGDGDDDIIAQGPHSRHGYEGAARRLYVNGGDPLNNGSPFFFDRTSGNLPAESARELTVIDFNGDGLLDLYLLWHGQNMLWRNSGAGRFESVTGIFMQAINDTSYHAEAADFDGDGFDDLFVANSGQKRLHLHQPDHTFSDVTDSHIRFNDAADTRHAAAGDLDLDGLPDLMMANYTRQRDRLYLNMGNAQLQDWTEQAMPTLGGNSHCVVLGDFDNDGDLDAFICDNGGQNRLLENRIRD